MTDHATQKREAIGGMAPAQM